MCTPLALIAALSLPVGGAGDAGAPGVPPDPRVGERIDGREPAADESGPGRTTLRIAAAPLRAAAWLVLTPIDRGVGWIERHKLPQHAYEALTSDDRLVGLRPLLRYEPGYAVAGGLRYFDERTLGPGSLVEASMRAGARSFESTFSLEPPGSRGVRLHLGYLRRNDAIFGGTHGETRAELRAAGLDVARYLSATAAATVSWLRSLSGPLGLELAGAFERRAYGNGITSGDTPDFYSIYCSDAAGGPCMVDPALVPGFEKGTRLFRAQGALTLDTRESRRYGAGIFARAGGAYAHGVAGDPSRHLAITAGVGGALPFGDRAFVVHLRGGMVEPLASAPIPFDELFSASGPLGIRGLPRGRLRGATELVATLEYRWLLSGWLDAVLFVDRGNAFGPRFEGLALDRTFTSGGLALVVFQTREIGYWQSQPLFGVQLAVSADDSLRVSFAMNTP